MVQGHPRSPEVARQAECPPRYLEKGAVVLLEAQAQPVEPSRLGLLVRLALPVVPVVPVVALPVVAKLIPEARLEQAAGRPERVLLEPQALLEQQVPSSGVRLASGAEALPALSEPGLPASAAWVLAALPQPAALHRS